jgi:hypothetical protein
MSFFVNQTKTVDLEGGNTVTLRKITFADKVDVQSRSMRMNGDGLSIDYPKYRLELLKKSLVSWDGPDFDGQPANAETIGQLLPSIGDKLATEAENLTNLGDEAGN